MNWDVTNNFLKDANLLFRKAFTYAGKVECQGRVVYNANKDSVSSEDAEEVMQILDRMERYDIIGELEGAMNCDKKHDDNVMNVWKTKMKENSYFFPLLSHINTDDYAKGDRSVPEDPKGFVRYIACEMALIYEDLYYYLCEFVRTYKLNLILSSCCRCYVRTMSRLRSRIQRRAGDLLQTGWHSITTWFLAMTLMKSAKVLRKRLEDCLGRLLWTSSSRP